MNRLIEKIFLLTILMALLWSGTMYAAACLGSGSTGDEVVLLQQRLKALHYEVGMVDGEFGRQTKKAVELFQQEHGLKRTGFVDNDTWTKLNLSIEPQAKKNAYKPVVYNSGFAEKIVFDAKHYLGVPYIWGGQSPKGFDCSGFVQYIFTNNGVFLPRTADLQYAKGLSVNKENLQNGDIVFFTTYTAGPSHDGIYVGNGQFISATTSRGIAIDKLDSVYWKTRYIGAKRITKID